jgi:hypothetical protein
MAHRAFYEDYRGPIPPGLVIDHLCRVRLCVNPSHMEIVTRGENTRRGRQTKLTAADARAIRATIRGLAERYGVSIRTLCGIGEGTSWRDA